MAIKVYTDASSNLFKKILDDKKLDINVLPMKVELEDKTFQCYSDDLDVEALSKEFYEKMVAGARPKTSLVSPGLFMSAVQDEVDDGNEVIYVSLASGISGSYQSACMVAEQVNDEAGKTVVRIIDSKTAGFGEAMVAIRAFELSQQGLSLDEVCAKTEEYVKTVRSEFTVDSIKYLAQTGRVNKLLAAVANALSIKPLLYGSDEAKIEVTQKVHGRKLALKTLTTQLINHIDDKTRPVYIAHCNAYDDALKIKEALAADDITNVEIYFYDLVTGVHVGPGTVAVFYEGKERAIKKNSIIPSFFKKKEEN